MRQSGAPFIGAIVGALLAFDQASKLWIQGNIRLQSSVDVIPGFLQLSHFVNRGAIGGFGWQSPLIIPVLITGSVALAILMVLLYHRYARIKRPSWRVKFFAALALTPLIAHTLDRLRQGYVVDFLQISGLPVFNFADIFPHLAIVFLGLEFAALLRSRRIARYEPRSTSTADNDRPRRNPSLSPESSVGEAPCA